MTKLVITLKKISKENISCRKAFAWMRYYRIRKWNFIQDTRLKNKIENNSTWEGAFYQSEWVKVYSSWVILVFSLYA